MNKKYILKHNEDIEEIFNKKNSVGSKYFTIYYDVYEGNASIAVSASKRLGSAVSRNYQKRTVKEILSEILGDLHGFKMLVVIKPSVLDLSYEEKKIQLNYIVNKMIRKENEK
ncbi:MAG: ribonuclease P protein component [Sphaerochaetaceae bacterium]|nr:ribonuclease P protein component [Sphaerochaetaceae bacterium]